MERIVLIGEKEEIEKAKEAVKDLNLEVNNNVLLEACIMDIENELNNNYDEYNLPRKVLEDISYDIINDSTAWGDYDSSIRYWVDEYMKDKLQGDEK